MKALVLGGKKEKYRGTEVWSNIVFLYYAVAFSLNPQRVPVGVEYIARGR